MIQGSLFIYTIAICGVIIALGWGRGMLSNKKNKKS